MKKTYPVKNLNELISAVEAAKKSGESVIDIEQNITLSHPVEIFGCENLEITSKNGCTVSGGLVNIIWKKENDYLTFDTETEPRMLLINGKPAQKTTYPENGYLENTDKCSYTWINSRNGGWDKAPSYYDLTHITPKPGDIPESFNISNCDIRVIHQWDESTVALKGYDIQTGIIECENEMAHPAGAFGVHKYQFSNTAFGCIQKGRWFYDRLRKKVYYAPSDGENSENIHSMIPSACSLFHFKNCKNISINNINLLLSNSTVGRISGLRAINPVGAVHIVDSENIRLDMLEISFSGGQGIKCLRCKNLSITNSIIENCASCGISTFECEDEHIAYNVINNIGLIDFSAVSIHAGGKSELVFVMDGCIEEHGQTVIEYNSIDGSPYCGITCCGGPHIIRNNKVVRCMKTLKDGGAIYCSRAEGSLISGNYVSDVPSDTAYAYYLDELSENCILDGNVSINVNVPFNAHIAKSCTLSNNLFVNNSDTTIRLMRSVNFSFSNNVIISEGKFTLGLKSYNPEEKFTLEECASFNGDIVCSPEIGTDNGEEINLRSHSIAFTKENDRFILSGSVNGICNRYIVGKTEPHCVITKIKPEKEEEYIRLHNEIWDMVVKNGHLYNIRKYSIFKYNGLYVSFFEYIGDDFENDMKRKAMLPITKKWQRLCSDCFEETGIIPEKIFFGRF